MPDLGQILVEAQTGQCHDGPELSSGERLTDNSRDRLQVYIEECWPIVQVEVENSKRIRKLPSHLQDYLCHTASLKDPSIHAPTLQKVSSGKSYPIANYVV